MTVSRLRPRSATRAPAVLLLFAAFALRVYRLGEQNVWWDEALAIWAVRRSLVETTLWTASDVHPPLFFWTLWPWVRLAGESEFAARFLTVVWSVLTAALAFALGRRLGGRVAGLLALGLVAISPLEVWWSMELRMYMLAAAAVLAAVYALARWVDAEGDRWLAAYVLAALAAVYTVYLAGAAVAMLNLAMLLLAFGQWTTSRQRGTTWRFDVRRGRYARWFAAQAVLVLLFLPWWWLAAGRMKTWAVATEPPPRGFAMDLWWTLLATGVSTDIERASAWAAVFFAGAMAACLVSALAFRRRVRRSGRWPTGGRRAGQVAVLLFLVIPPIAVNMATQPRAFFYTPAIEARYFVPFAAPVYVLVGCALADVWRRYRHRLAGTLFALVVTAAVAVPLAVHLPGYYAGRRLRDELQTMVMAIWSQAEPDDVVLLVSGNRYPVFRYYYDRPWDARSLDPPFRFPADHPPRWGDRPPVVEFPGRGSDPVAGGDWRERLDELVASHQRVWLAEVEPHLQDPDGQVEAWLAARRARVLSEAYGSNALHLFASQDQPPRLTRLSSDMPWVEAIRPPPTAPASVWEPPLQLLYPMAGLPAGAVVPGDTLNVTLFGRDLLAPRPRPFVLRGGFVDDLVAATVTVRLVPFDRVARPPAWQRTMPRATDARPPDRVRFALPVSERMPSGQYGVQVEVGGRSYRAGVVDVRGTLPLVERVRPLTPQGEAPDFGFTRLVAVGVTPTEARPGEAVVVDLHWTVHDDRGPLWNDRHPLLTEPPIVFAHLVGPPRPGTGDPVWAGQDGEPSGGDWASVAVSGGEALFDRHVLVVDPAAPSGDYTIEVGLYAPDGGERHAVTGALADSANRRVVVGAVRVR